MMRGLPALICTLLLAQSALAAPGNPDLGVKIGEKSRLHLGADLGAGFDTNPNYRPMSADFVGDLSLALRPRMQLDIPGSLLNLDAGATLNYQEYFGVMNAATRSLRQLDGDAHLNVEINREGMFGFALSDRLTRALDPGVAALGSRLARTRNDAAAGVEFRPGGGLLTFSLKYMFGLEIFDRHASPSLLDDLGLYVSNPQIANPEYFDNMEHRLILRSEWRFLPKTGAFINIFGGAFNYLHPSSSNVANYPVGIEIGAMGAVTSKISGVAKLGYANPLIIANGAVTSAAFIGVIGQLEARYQITEMNIVTVGARRQLRPVYMYTFFTDNRVYAETSHALFERFMLKGNAAYALLAFDQPTGDQASVTTLGGTSRMDHVIEGNLSASYYIFDWLSVGISDMLQFRLTNAIATDSSTNLSFLKNLTLISVSAFY